MIPKTGQHVKIVFRNGTVTEGIVEGWFNNVVQLKALDGESNLIITNPEQDIMLIKVWDEKFEEPQPEPTMPEPPRWEDEEKANYSTESLRKEFQERLYGKDQTFEEAAATHDPSNPDDRKSLAELRVELAKQERKIIAEKLREHRPSAYKPTQVPYHYLPGIPEPKRSAYQPARIPNGRTTKKPRPQ